MLHDFTYYNPTKIYFGKDSMQNLSAELVNYGKNILLLYGKNSIKKIGLYDEVVKILNACGKKITELSGIKPILHIVRCLRVRDLFAKIRLI